MNSNIKRLITSISQLISFLEKVPNGKTWVDILSGIQQKISINSSREEGINMLDRYFGGMGSLNDIYFHKDNRNIPIGYTAEQANREYEKVLNTVFKNLKLINGSFFDRVRWELLRFKYRKNPPPRIINAFERNSQ